MQEQPAHAEIQLQDLSGQLVQDDVPEWERMPFPLPVLEPSDDNEQATPWRVNVGTLKSFPARLRHPPPPPGLPKLRRYTVIPEYDVPLSDILQDKHASPLSLREFEEYLLYVERGAENLYFCLWLQQYTDEYERQVAESDARPSSCCHCPGSKPIPVPPNETLAGSFQRARELFFDSASQYELNVTDDMIDPVRHLVRTPKSSGPPKRRKEAWEEDDGDNGVDGPSEEQPLAVSKDLSTTMYARPRDLEKIKCEVEGLLRQSLTRFLQLAFTNAGRSHDKIAYGVWGVYTAAALAASVSLIVGRKPRALRLIVFPFLLGAWCVLFAVLNGVCTAIYAFGDARQLYPYELYVIRCRARQGEPYARPVDYKGMGDRMLIGKSESVEPIIQPHTLYRPRRDGSHAIFDKMRWFVPWRNFEEERDVEQGGGAQGGEEDGSYEGSTRVGSVSYGGGASTRSGPSFPSLAYIPTSPHSTLQRSQIPQQPAQQPTFTSAPNPSEPQRKQPGAFSITSLNPKTPPIPPNWGEPERRLVRAMDLDLGDPRALSVYGPMVNIPSGLVRRVHREIFVRSMWMSLGVSVVIVGVLLVIPVPS
ncbi:hypothetical protein FRC12_011057 [Ceratobasidium sp. 428]|nr:hypothetical protein FRC12_011057 [Ceratobasidium sp. 428]